MLQKVCCQEGHNFLFISKFEIQINNFLKLELSRPKRMNQYDVSTGMWPEGYFYPSFCTGPCYMMERNALKLIYDVAIVQKNMTKTFPLEVG